MIERIDEDSINWKTKCENTSKESFKDYELLKL